MKELIKQAIADLKKAEGYVFVSPEGNRVDLQEAASKGIPVTPVNAKTVVLNKLEAAGLHLSESKFVQELHELIALVHGGGSAAAPKAGRQSFSDHEKNRIVEEWRKIEAAGGKKKAAFAREMGIGYQTFINWLRK